MTSLNTFGAILTFAINLEAQMSAYLKQAGRDEAAAAAEKRRAKLERVRREHVLEITLEAIDGLNEAHYAVNTADVSAQGQATAAQIAAQFYQDVAPKINVREAQRALEKCGKEYQTLAS